ncbi:MAG: hypothetical protein AB7S61_07700 [Methanoregulaceae archaeon]
MTVFFKASGHAMDTRGLPAIFIISFCVCLATLRFLRLLAVRAQSACTCRKADVAWVGVSEPILPCLPHPYVHPEN